MRRRLIWLGDGAPRMEVAHVERTAPEFVASGTQLGVTYELQYRLEQGRLHLELNRERSAELELDGADFFDLGWSPLFNSLPVIRDGLLEPGRPRDYLMRWVEVPSLEVSMSEQRYEPLGHGVVRFRAGDFVSDIAFDSDGFVVNYPGIGARPDAPAG
jgi:Putative glycolipid-binding